MQLLISPRLRFSGRGKFGAIVILRETDEDAIARKYSLDSVKNIASICGCPESVEGDSTLRLFWAILSLSLIVIGGTILRSPTDMFLAFM